MPYYDRDPKKDHNFDNHPMQCKSHSEETSQEKRISGSHLPWRHSLKIGLQRVKGPVRRRVDRAYSCFRGSIRSAEGLGMV